MFALNHIQDVALIKSDFSGDGNSHETFRIEAYDVAHISGTNTVGVMVVVENGSPNKAEYRKFKINNSVQNDVAGLAEMLERRLKHSEWQFPNIIVVDGSVAQKNVAEKIISTYGRSPERRKNFGAKIDVVAVTKDERHRPKTIQGREDIIEKYKKDICLPIAKHTGLRSNITGRKGIKVVSYKKQTRSLWERVAAEFLAGNQFSNGINFTGKIAVKNNGSIFCLNLEFF